MAAKEDFMIRFGLLGCGRIAKRHADLLGGNQIEGASLVAVCDQVRTRAETIASTATCRSPSVRFLKPTAIDSPDASSR